MNRKFDIILYGASGFTGIYVLESIVKSDEFNGITYAVAGRDRRKLEKVLSDVSQRTGKDLTKVPIIIANSDSEKELADMAKQAKVIVNVVGPVRYNSTSFIKHFSIVFMERQLLKRQ